MKLAVLNQKEKKDIQDEVKTWSPEMRYQMLGRMQQDCEYYLGFGGRYEKHLWAKNIASHIYYMKVLYNSFIGTLKPQWISMDDILMYEARM